MQMYMICVLLLPQFCGRHITDLYDEVNMPPELRKAHQQNDKTVMQAYDFWGKLNTETKCVAELMKMYQNLAR